MPYRRCGKLIVATDETQLPGLDALLARASANGVDDLQRLGGSQITALEPQLKAVAGLLSPSTGIVDSHALMRLSSRRKPSRALLRSHLPLLAGVARRCVAASLYRHSTEDQRAG